MHAEYVVELGRDDAALELPWRSEDGRIRHYDLKRNPELVTQIPEATGTPELSAFLTRINAATFPLATAKCDLWFTTELAEDEDVFGAAGKFVSYVDLVFAGDGPRSSLETHESMARSLCELLKRAPEMAASIELVIRRCYFHIHDSAEESQDGYAITVYVAGFGDEEQEARKRWSIALTLLQHALVQAVR